MEYVMTGRLAGIVCCRESSKNLSELKEKALLGEYDSVRIECVSFFKRELVCLYVKKDNTMLRYTELGLNDPEYLLIALVDFYKSLMGKGVSPKSIISVKAINQRIEISIDNKVVIENLLNEGISSERVKFFYDNLVDALSREIKKPISSLTFSYNSIRSLSQFKLYYTRSKREEGTLSLIAVSNNQGACRNGYISEFARL